MAKFALCIDAKDYTKSLSEWKPRLIDRAICETDETTLQIIPYITLVDNATKEIFSYTRGKAGQEDRLHAKKSIGIGGHMDFEIETTLIELIASEAAREIEEETGFRIDADGIVDIEENIAVYSLYHKLYTPNAINSVDRVHVAIAFTVYVDKDKLTKLEDGIILEPKWLTQTELYVLARSENTPLENWSLILALLPSLTHIN